MADDIIEVYRAFMLSIAQRDMQGALARVDPEAYSEQCVGFTAGWVHGFTAALDSFMRRVAPNLPPIGAEEIEVLASGDRVIARTRVTAVHAGAVFGRPGTGQKVVYDVVDIVRVVEGRIVWRYLVPDLDAILAAVGGPAMFGEPTAGAAS
jgi:predicted ester cyclase